MLSNFFPYIMSFMR